MKTGVVTSMEKTEIPNMPVNYDTYLVEAWTKYIPISDEETTLEAIIEAGDNFLIEGEKGIGKTLLVYHICTKHKIRLLTLKCSTGTSVGDILGKYQLLGDNSVFVLGALPRAIECANLYGQAVLYLDELNALDPEVQKELNSLLDDRKSVIANNQIYKLENGAKLSIVAAMNPVYYSGTSPLNEELRSRFVGTVWEYPKPKQIEPLIDWSGVPDMVKEKLFLLMADTLGARREGELDYVLSIRDAGHFVKMYRLWAKCGYSEDKTVKEKGLDTLLEKTVKTAILIKFEDAKQREYMKVKCNQTFGVDIE